MLPRRHAASPRSADLQPRLAAGTLPAEPLETRSSRIGFFFVCAQARRRGDQFIHAYMPVWRHAQPSSTMPFMRTASGAPFACGEAWFESSSWRQACPAWGPALAGPPLAARVPLGTPRGPPRAASVLTGVCRAIRRWRPCRSSTMATRFGCTSRRARPCRQSSACAKGLNIRCRIRGASPTRWLRVRGALCGFAGAGYRPGLSVMLTRRSWRLHLHPHLCLHPHQPPRCPMPRLRWQSRRRA